MKAIIYTTKTCAYCPMVKKYLTSKGVEFEERNAEDPEVGEEALRISGAMTVPITVIGSSVIVGWNVSQLAEAVKLI